MMRYSEWSPGWCFSEENNSSGILECGKRKGSGKKAWVQGTESVSWLYPFEDNEDSTWTGNRGGIRFCQQCSGSFPRVRWPPYNVLCLRFFREHNDKCVQLVRYGHGACNRAALWDILEAYPGDFVWETYHKKDVLLDEVSRQFIEDYEFWLKTEKKCCHNTATKYLKNFKKIIRIALAKGWMKNDPFLEIRFSLDKVEPGLFGRFRNPEADIEGNWYPRLSQVRDIFVFCCFTGLAFSDIHGLRKEHIVEDSNGVRWIRKGRQKTKIMCNIPLMEIHWRFWKSIPPMNIVRNMVCFFRCFVIKKWMHTSRNWLIFVVLKNIDHPCWASYFCHICSGQWCLREMSSC